MALAIDLLPDSVLISILVRAAAPVLPPSDLPLGIEPCARAADLRALARFRPVCWRFNRLTYEVEAIFCELWETEAMDARIILYLHEAHNIKVIHLACRDALAEQAFSSGFMAGVFCLAPSLQHFHLSGASLLSSHEPDEVLGQLLTKCPLLESFILENCHLAISTPIFRSFVHLRELQLSLVHSINGDSLVSLVQAAPNLNQLSLHVKNDSCLNLVTKISSSMLEQLSLDYNSPNLDKDSDDLEDRAQLLGCIEINTPRLDTLHLHPDGRRVLKIDAPNLTSLKVGTDYPGPFVILRPWKLKSLVVTDCVEATNFLHLLEQCGSLDSADFVDMVLTGETGKKHSILTCLQNVRNLRTRASVLFDPYDGARGRSVQVPPFRNLVHLVLQIESREEAVFCLQLIEMSPNLQSFQYLGPRDSDGSHPIFKKLSSRRPWLTINDNGNW